MKTEEQKIKDREYYKLYREKNKEKLAKQQKDWHERNPDKKTEATKKYYQTHKEKVCAKNKRWVENNREKYNAISYKWNNSHKKQRKDIFKKWWLESRYKITVEELDNMLDKQNGMCKICGILLIGDRKGTKPAVDHCHSTGKIRGILCGSCNSALGFLHDSQENLERAIQYLKDNS